MPEGRKTLGKLYIHTWENSIKMVVTDMMEWLGCDVFCSG
jgi:hypothetical protein